MGGGLTVRILSEGEPLLSGFGELILEPQSDIDRVRAWLLEHGFYLAQENFVEEDGKYYPILRAVHGEKEDLKAEELFYGPLFWKTRIRCCWNICRSSRTRTEC